MAEWHVQALDDLMTTFGMEMAETGRELRAVADQVAALAGDPAHLEQFLIAEHRRHHGTGR